MTRLVIIIFCCIFCYLGSCKKRPIGSDVTLINIYKFKNGKDYSDNACVELSEDKSKITSKPGRMLLNWPVELVSSYYLNGTMGVNSGYLSLTREEYNSFDIIPSNDSLYSLLIDKDPYLEFYYRFDNNRKFWNENGAYGIDTAYINELIMNNRLEDYFVRLK